MNPKFKENLKFLFILFVIAAAFCLTSKEVKAQCYCNWSLCEDLPLDRDGCSPPVDFRFHGLIYNGPGCTDTSICENSYSGNTGPCGSFCSFGYGNSSGLTSFSQCIAQCGGGGVNNCPDSLFPQCGNGTCSGGRRCGQQGPVGECGCICDLVNTDLKVDIGAGLVDGPVTVGSGVSFTLNWDGSDNTDCTLDGLPVPHDGSGTFSTTSSHTYSFFCERGCLRADSDIVEVNVISRPQVCLNSTITSNTLSCPNSVNITLNGLPPVGRRITQFYLGFYNLDNLYSPGNPKPLMVNATTQYVRTYNVPAGPAVNSYTFTIPYSDLQFADQHADWDGSIADNIQTNGYFILDDGSFSAADPDCIKQFVITNPAPSNCSLTGSSFLSIGESATFTAACSDAGSDLSEITFYRSSTTPFGDLTAGDNWGYGFPEGSRNPFATCPGTDCACSSVATGMTCMPLAVAFDTGGTYYVAVNASDSLACGNDCTGNPWCAGWNPVPAIGTEINCASLGFSDCGINDYRLVTVNDNPWWQSNSGDVTTNGLITSKVPAGENFIENGPAVVSYNSVTAASFTPGNMEANGEWLVQQNTYTAGFDGYNSIWNKLPQDVRSAIVTNGSLGANTTASNLTSGGYQWPVGGEYYYYIYDPGFTSTDLTLEDVSGNINVVGSRKVIVFVKGSDININSNVALTDGTGFIMIVSDQSINIDYSVTSLEGIFVADDNINTGSQRPTIDLQLSVRGFFAAGLGSAGGRVNLERNMLTNNPTTPGETFTYAPDILMNYPINIGYSTFNWREVSP